MGQIDKYSGFWYNERKKRWICRCTLPMQGLLHICKFLFEFSIYFVAPYLCRDYYADTASLASSRLHLTYPGIKHKPKRQKAKLHESFAFSYTHGKPRPTL